MISRFERGSSSDAGSWALYFASLGIRVAPAFEVDHQGRCGCLNSACRRPGKHPLFQEDWSTASTDTAQIKSWWRRRPSANLLVQTGSRSKLLVIDADTRAGGIRSLEALQERFCELRNSFLVRSGSGGRHVYLHTSRRWRSGTDSVCSGIDVRGEGGYVIGPGSHHFSGVRYTAESLRPILPVGAELESHLRQIGVGGPVSQKNARTRKEPPDRPVETALGNRSPALMDELGKPIPPVETLTRRRWR